MFFKYLEYIIMYKIETDVWYYIYIDDKDLYISTDPPVRSDKDQAWYHPDYNYRCLMRPIMFGDPEASENIIEWKDISISEATIK